MERFDVSEGARLAEMVHAAEGGHEVVITTSGREIARLVASFVPNDIASPEVDGEADLLALERVRDTLPPAALKLNWSGALNQMREEDRF